LPVEEVDDLADRPHAEERGEDQVDPPLDLAVGVLDHAPGLLPHQADRQGQGQVAPLGLVEEPGGQAGPQGV
jgi:hypothetical protein